MKQFLRLLLLFPLPFLSSEGIRFRFLILSSVYWGSFLNRKIIRFDGIGADVYHDLKKIPILRDRRKMEYRFFASIALRYIYIFPRHKTYFLLRNLHFNFLMAFLLEIPMQIVFNSSVDDVLPYIKAYQRACETLLYGEFEYDSILDDFHLHPFLTHFYAYGKKLRRDYGSEEKEAMEVIRMQLAEGIEKFFRCLYKDIEGRGIPQKSIAIEEYGRYSSYQAKYYSSFWIIFYTKIHHPDVREYLLNPEKFAKLESFVLRVSEIVSFSQDYNVFPQLFRKGDFYSWVYLYCIENNYFDIGQIEAYVRGGYKQEDYDLLTASIDHDALKSYFIRRLGSMIEDLLGQHYEFIEGATYIELILGLMNPKIKPLEREKKTPLFQNIHHDKRKYINFVYGINTIFSSLNSFQEICQQFVDEIEKNFNFTGAVLFLKDENGEYVYPFTVSQTAVISKVLQILPVGIQSMKIPMAEKDHLVIKAMMTKQYYIDKDYSKFSPSQAKSFAPYIQKFAGIRVGGAFPIMYKNEVLGVLVISSNSDSFTRDDIYLIKVLSNIVGNAIKNWHLTHQLEDQVKSLEISNKFKTEVLEIASHELRTPATIIRDALSMIREDDDEERAMYINYARMAAARQILLVNNILNTSMIEGKSFELAKTRFSLDALVQKITTELQIFIVDKHITMGTELEPVEILADEQKIGQVIYNLIYNAVKHTKKGSITVSLKRQDSYALLQVADTGTGIDPQNIVHIFEKYNTANNDVNKKIFATGIGLYISKYIVNAHGGTISVDSQLNKGSVFTIMLPLEQEF